MSINERDIRERRFAHEIRTALDASAEALPADIAERLAAARRIALARRKAEVAVPVPQLAMPGPHVPMFDEDDSPLHRAGAWLRRLGLIWTLVALAAGLMGIYHWQQQKRVEELADVDAAMLLDDLPPTAYADEGFHVFLKHGQ
ncbi:DUF3619 family protein [Cupriavidus oxalaticus]|jgi:hypothetical protein|uniref:DUF3619 family protein n=1 Tax=Cupriavidus oxalaticus TaxID=96344 RepID=A0A375G9T3_9BURK|nr:DUF3619 family protein [Cupriavidus oxalaticus]QEZ46043.1 DUF3619 family protein [Cupriavidus oxalaticus]QRQ86551.1 DUF3619 family protein [Cupriavidus oxalaticus]QRQ95121.1 DUF3619 family protein [Cupriavidus oxalaticus]WQD83778.1 DUF3619 family protein [Cupriavidus oxalaticus]SPC17058.1 Membrane protein [Cupriavidus oxalaticus]